jgi:hypothetical protein
MGDEELDRKVEAEEKDWQLQKFAAGLHKAHYTVEDVRAAFMAGAERAWMRLCCSFPVSIKTEFEAEVLRRWPEEGEG